MIKLKRVYEAPSRADGYRVLVDRLWPRGLRKEEAAIDLWLKEVAPSGSLRVWFGHDPLRWKEFVRLYRSELADNGALEQLRRITGVRKVVTLVYAARDTEHTHALVIRDALAERERGGRR